MTDDDGRDHGHRFDAGHEVQLPGPGGVPAPVRQEFRFAQGLRADLVAPLGARPDLCARLWGMALWDADPAELAAAVEALLAEPAP